MTTSNALNISAAGIVAFDGKSVFFGRTLTAGSGVTITDGDGTLGNPTISATGSGGTVTTLSVMSANGLAGTVANPTTTPAITLSTTITGLLSGNGTAISGSAITQYDVLVGGASNAVSSVGPGTAGQILQSGGNAANPSYSTSTYPSTNAVNTLLYASSANTMAALSTANNGVLITSNTGVPSWLANSGTAGYVLTANSSAPASWQATAQTVTSVATSNATPQFSLSGTTETINFGITNLLLGSAGSSISGAIQNVGLGFYALNGLVGGSGQVAIGYFSLLDSTGSLNTAVGGETLPTLLGGSSNTVLGYSAGSLYTGSESSNILIKNTGSTGESNTIRLGTQGSSGGQQDRNFQAGITGVTVTASAPVAVDTNGQLSSLGFGTSTQVLTSNGASSSPTWQAPASGTVTSVSGTANQVAVATGTTTPVISLIGPYTPSTYTAHGVILGEGTSSLVATAVGTTGQVLTGVTGADPVWASPATSGTVTSVSGTANQVSVATGTTTPVISLIGPYTPSTYTAHGVILGEGTSSMVATSAGTSGQLFQSGGASTDGTWTTNTYPSTDTTGDILYASTTNTISGLGIGSTGQLLAVVSGLPAWANTFKGSTSGSNPAAGFIGELISSAVGTGAEVSMTASSLTATEITSISLTAGVWDISAIACCNLNGATVTVATLSINSSVANGTQGSNYVFFFPGVASLYDGSGSIPQYRVNLSGAATYYLIMACTYSVATPKGYGRISATRVG